MALISTQNATIMMEVSSSTSSSYYPFCYPSSLFSVYPFSFALIPTRNRLSIGEQQCRQETFMIKTLQNLWKIAIFQVLPLQLPSETLDSHETEEWGVLPLERFLFFSIKNINPAEWMKIREINWNPHRWKGFSLRVTPCIYIYTHTYGGQPPLLLAIDNSSSR